MYLIQTTKIYQINDNKSNNSYNEKKDNKRKGMESTD